MAIVLDGHAEIHEGGDVHGGASGKGTGAAEAEDGSEGQESEQAGTEGFLHMNTSFSDIGGNTP